MHWRPTDFPDKACISQVYHNLLQVQVHFADDLVARQCLSLHFTGFHTAPLTREVCVQSCMCKHTGHLSHTSVGMGAAGTESLASLSPTLSLSYSEKRLHLEVQGSGMDPRRLNFLMASSSNPWSHKVVELRVIYIYIYIYIYTYICIYI